MRRTRLLAITVVALTALTFPTSPALAGGGSKACRVNSALTGSDTVLASANIIGDGNDGTTLRSYYTATDNSSLIEQLQGITSYKDAKISFTFELEGASCSSITYELKVYDADADVTKDTPLQTFSIAGDDQSTLVSPTHGIQALPADYTKGCVVVVGTSVSSKGATLDRAPDAPAAAKYCTGDTVGGGTSFH